MDPLKMYFLLEVGIFQPAMLVYQRVIITRKLQSSKLMSQGKFLILGYLSSLLRSFSKSWLVRILCYLMASTAIYIYILVWLNFFCWTLNMGIPSFYINRTPQFSGPQTGKNGRIIRSHLQMSRFKRFEGFRQYRWGWFKHTTPLQTRTIYLVKMYLYI